MVPYQLHCWPLTALETLELLALLLTTAIEEELLALLGATDETGVDEALPPQILPVIAGRSALPPRLSTWKPNCTLWPGWMEPFQLKLLAE